MLESVESPTPNDDVASQAAPLPWYHSIELPGGFTTAGVVDNKRVLPRLALPSSLKGKTVLDIGAWDGFYSFECARRGAADVLATDSFCWDGRGWGSKDSFEFARNQLGLGAAVRDLTIDPTELDPSAIGGVFDIVLLLGVLYHLQDPIDVLRRAAKCCGELLVLETESTLNWLPFPAARVFPGSELNGDSTNWYQFNARALHGLLREVGFKTTAVVYQTAFHRRFARAARDRIRGKSFRAGFYSSRIVIHARKN